MAGLRYILLLAPGFYDVRIRDRAHIGCVIVLNPALEITETASLSATVASTDVTCNGANDGTITVSGRWRNRYLWVHYQWRCLMAEHRHIYECCTRNI